MKVLRAILAVMLGGSRRSSTSAHAQTYDNCYSCAQKSSGNYLCEIPDPNDAWKLTCCSENDGDKNYCRPTSTLKCSEPFYKALITFY